MGFIGMTYLHLTGALALTAVSSEYPLTKSLIITLIEILAIIAISFLIVRAKPGPYKYFLFATFAILIGQILGPTVDKLQERGALREVLASIAGIFLAMTAAGFLDNQNILRFGGYLFAALLGLIVARLAIIIITEVADQNAIDFTKANTILSWVGTVLFAIYVAYDTQTLKGRQQKPYDYVNSSLGLFTDIINLFTNVANLFMEEE
jgi:FtsH-binding integral membrane protein